MISMDQDNYTIPEYKVAMEVKEEIEVDIEILEVEKIEIKSLRGSLDLQMEVDQEKISETEE